MFQNILKDTNAGKYLGNLFNHYLAMYCENDGLESSDNENVWKEIVQVGHKHLISMNKRRNPNYQRENDVIGRYEIDPEDIIRNLTKHDPILLKEKCMAEVAIGNIVNDIIGRFDGRNDSTSRLRFPGMGSTLILTTADARRQRPHYEYNVSNFVEIKTLSAPFMQPERNVPYVIYATGEKVFQLWIWHKAHFLFNGSRHSARKIMQDLTADKIYIGPYSILILRGDMPTAEVASIHDGDMQSDSPPTLRLQLYTTIENSPPTGTTQDCHRNVYKQWLDMKFPATEQGED